MPINQVTFLQRSLKIGEKIKRELKIEIVYMGKQKISPDVIFAESPTLNEVTLEEIFDYIFDLIVTEKNTH